MKIAVLFLLGLVLGLYSALVIQWGWNNLIVELFDVTKLTYLQVYSAVSMIGVIVYTTKMPQTNDDSDLTVKLVAKFLAYSLSWLSLFILTLFL